MPAEPAAGPRPHRAVGTVLVVDDSMENLLLLTHALEGEGYRVLSATDGETGLQLTKHDPPDLVLLDIRLPGIDGFEVCRRVKRRPSTRLTPVVLVTGLLTREDRIAGINAGADDFVTKPYSLKEMKARVRSLIRLKRYTDELESPESMILSLALIIEARDATTDGHCQRLASYATAFGAHLGLGEEDLMLLHRGGYLHDVGKIGIPDTILLKRGALAPDEYERMKLHTIVGDRVCGQLRSLRGVRPIVRHHHERLNGSGYPDGLRGDAIPLLAHIVSIVDLYDAMTTSRPYRAALAPECACEALAEEAGRGWRRTDLVDAFLALVRAGELPNVPLAHAVGSRGGRLRKFVRAELRPVHAHFDRQMRDILSAARADEHGR